MKKILINLMAAAGMTVAGVAPAMAATSTQCDQAEASVQKLYQLSAYYNTTNPTLSKAYNNMAKSQQQALTYYC